MASTDVNIRDQTQQKVFTRWVNLHLGKAREQFVVNDLSKDLISGEGLILLSEVFVPGPPTKYAKGPKNQLQRTQNHSQAISRFEGDHLQLVNIHASTLANDDASANNLKVFMGYIFQLILKYSVGNIDDELDADNKKKQQSLAQLKAGIIQWVNKQLATLTPEQSAAVRKFNNCEESTEKLEITNLENDWVNGTALTGLAISLHPEDKREHGLERLNQMAQQNGGDNAALAATIQRSFDNLTVPALMEASEMSNSPDQNSILTYVSAFKQAKYVDDAPTVEHAKIEWSEAEFLKIEVDALQARDLSAIAAQKEIIVQKLDEYKQNKAEEKVYEPSCDHLAARMELHLARITAIVDNDAADKTAANGTADENAAALAQKQEEIDAANAKAAEDAATIAKKQEELDAANKALEEEQAKAKKLEDDLAATKAALEKLQRRQTKLGLLQEALLTCAAISDEMMADEQE